MGLSDWFSGSASTSTASGVTGVNDVPAPQSDTTLNAPPPDQHKRVIDFIAEAPGTRYTFDSRANTEVPYVELCRATPQGGRSCLKVDMHSKALFKSMQTIGFYCALPAEPHRTDMQCDRIPVPKP